MTGLETITTAYSGIKTALEISKSLKNLDIKIEKADLKIKIAELMESLAEAKCAIVETQDFIREKDDEILKLKEAFKTKAKLKRFMDVYYEIDEAGQMIGDPNCSCCWETKQDLIHVVQNPSKRRNYVCPVCKTESDWHIPPERQKNK
ncbi:MAG: hypothetical protein ABII18_05805 [bacterium]